MILPPDLFSDLANDVVGRRDLGVGGRAEHLLRHGVMRLELLLPIGEMRPGLALEEGILRRGERVRVRQRAAADTDPVEHGDVLEERHLEDPVHAHRGPPHPLLEVAIVFREVIFPEALALLEDEDAVALLGESQRRDAPAEAGADDDVVEVLGHHIDSRSIGAGRQWSEPMAKPIIGADGRGAEPPIPATSAAWRASISTTPR